MDARTQRQYDGQRCSDLPAVQPHPLVAGARPALNTCSRVSSKTRFNEATGKQLYTHYAFGDWAHFPLRHVNQWHNRPTPLQRQLHYSVLINICRVCVLELLSHASVLSTFRLQLWLQLRDARDETLVLTPWFLGSPLTAEHPGCFHVWQLLAGSASASVERLWHRGLLSLPWFSFPLGSRTAVCSLLMRPNERTRHTFKTSLQYLPWRLLHERSALFP